MAGGRGPRAAGPPRALMRRKGGTLTAAPRSSTLSAAVGTCLERGLTFAAWRLPDTGRKIIAIQNDDRLDAVDELGGLASCKGFVVAPFRAGPGRRAFAIRPDILAQDGTTASLAGEIDSLEAGGGVDRPSGPPIEVGRDEYLGQARLVIDAIRGGDYDKVVLSRVKSVPGDFGSRLGDIFDLLCESYANAFVYLFQAGGRRWVGATPETLLCSKDGRLATVSLAGTRPYAEANLDLARWNGKERAEQEYVTRQIEGILADFGVRGAERTGPYARRAGNLLHLCSEFSFPSGELSARLGAFVDALHPTSAVCGIPKAGAMDLIASVERHDREFYAGYIGPVGLGREPVQLFVNLRCMKVHPDRLSLFVGGGITADSVPEDEWEETELKSETLLSIVGKVT